MNILVVGCGKVGARLAELLSREGHDVSVVDRSEEHLDALAEDYEGFKTCGIPIDQDVLRRAGIANCDALAAVSSDDNTNIMVSELAHSIFHVDTVLARIYDPEREEVFSHLGLHTVCPTNLTVSAVYSTLIERDRPRSVNINSHTISFATEEVPKSLDGALVEDLELSPSQMVYGVVHQDHSIELYRGQRLRLSQGDKVIITNLVD